MLPYDGISLADPNMTKTPAMNTRNQ